MTTLINRGYLVCYSRKADGRTEYQHGAIWSTLAAAEASAASAVGWDTEIIPVRTVFEEPEALSCERATTGMAA